ncbi:transketolase [Synergistales bacterium]|nr:transketolase [Synergistales bacterium]
MTSLSPLSNLRHFAANDLTDEQAGVLRDVARQCRLDAVLMTGIAQSGHVAGALSGMDIFNLLLAVANTTPENCRDLSRDKIVVSHGHASAAAYATLAAWGFTRRDDVVPNFRRAGSPYQGHVERTLKGIDWGTGNLGQGLSAGVGFAIADRVCGREDARVFVVMGDGEQPKGQLAEARRTASRFKLSRVTALIDVNHIQISGRTEDVMPANIKALWEADGWSVSECDGHDYRALYIAMKKAAESDAPTVILCETVMGKGVSFMEGIPDYHGKPASGDLLAQAIRELGGEQAEYELMKSLRSGALPKGFAPEKIEISLDLGTPKTYTQADKKDARGAFGAALADVADKNAHLPGRTPIIAFDCDLAGSVKLDIFAETAQGRGNFFQMGIQEHNTATAAGAASIAGVVPVWADFGVFGADEAYNQQRLNDINHAAVKTAVTHVGLDVGEDGVTHQCIDYVSLPNNFFGYKAVVPADPNQTDRATRWMLAEEGCVLLAMGRGVHPIILGADGKPFFGGEYKFKYGEIDKLREGSDATILSMGCVAASAISAAEALSKKGISARVLHVSSPLAIDREELIGLIKGRPLVTCEDHNVNTGLGAITALHIAQSGIAVKIKNLGVWRYGDSGKSVDVVAAMGFAAEDIAAAVESML